MRPKIDVYCSQCLGTIMSPILILLGYVLYTCSKRYSGSDGHKPPPPPFLQKWEEWRLFHSWEESEREWAPTQLWGLSLLELGASFFRALQYNTTMYSTHVLRVHCTVSAWLLLLYCTVLYTTTVKTSGGNIISPPTPSPRRLAFYFLFFRLPWVILLALPSSSSLLPSLDLCLLGQLATGRSKAARKR